MFTVRIRDVSGKLWKLCCVQARRVAEVERERERECVRVCEVQMNCI
jgi:hypothetical protein